MITEDYVSFELAKMLKEKGFDEACITFYDVNDSNKRVILLFQEDETAVNYMENSTCNETEITAPTLQMAMKWLREKKDIQIEISIVGTDTWESPTKWVYGFRCQTKNVIDRRNADFLSYEEAVEAALKYCLENLI